MVKFQLTREVKLPHELAAAFTTGRPELCKTFNRKMTKTERENIIDAMGVMIETLYKMAEDHEKEVYMLGRRIITLRSAANSSRLAIQRESALLQKAVEEEGKISTEFEKERLAESEPKS